MGETRPPPIEIEAKTLAAPTPAAPVGDGELWPALLSAAAGNRRLRVLLQDCRLGGASEGGVALLVKPSLLAFAQTCAPEIESLVAAIRGRATKVELRGDGAPAGEATVGAGGNGTVVAPTTAAADHPLVKQALELFGGRVVQVYPRN